MAVFLLELARLDRLAHVVRLLAVDGSVVEFDPRQALLARPLDRVLARAPAEGWALVDDLVLDLCLVERLLDAPARMLPLYPLVLAAMELDRHAVSSRLGRRPGRDLHFRSTLEPPTIASRPSANRTQALPLPS